MFSLFPSRGLAAIALIGALSLTACDSGEPDDDSAGEEELISQVTLSLTETDDGATQTIQVTFDEDGTNPTFSPSRLTLRPGVSYDGSIMLRDTFNDEDITAEIREEAEEHLFRYALTPSSAGTVRITDTESSYSSENVNGGDFAVGLTFEVDIATSASGTGTMEALLYHFDEAPKTSSTATSDEIDVEIAFPVTFAAGV